MARKILSFAQRGDPVGKAPQGPARANNSQDMGPSLLVSFMAHVVLLLILSLIVLGNRQFDPPFVLTANQAMENSSLVELPSFSIEPALDLEMPPNLIPQVEFDLPVDIPTPLALRIEEVSRSDAIAPGETKRPDALAAVALPTSANAVSIQRRVSDAGGRKGEVQFALAWKNINDVDLHVITPAGEHISHLHKRSSDRGLLDVDMNVKGESSEPVENVRWITQAPWGRYTVLVNLFRIHRPTSANARVYRGSEFQLLAQLGAETQVFDATVSRGKQLAVFRFRYVADSVPTGQRELLLAELELLQSKEEAMARPLLEQAKAAKPDQLRDRMLSNLISQYPHSDTAIDAMRLLGGEITKR